MQNLSWNERFAIIEHFGLKDEIACLLFNISNGELVAARTLRDDDGLFQPPPNYDYDKYKPLVETFLPPITPADPAQVDNYDEEPDAPPPAPKAKTPATRKAKKSTAQKPKDPPKKRGRKTHKIKDAYEAIPRQPVPVEEFMAKHNVSLSVLRRHKNFDHIPETGQVNVRKMPLILNGTSEKVLCIWRAEPNE